LFNVNRIRKSLARIEESLVRLVGTSPDKPIVSDDVREEVFKAYDAGLSFYNQVGGLIVPIYYREIFRLLHLVTYYLEWMVGHLRSICDEVDRIGVPVHPNPCETHTLDFHVEWLIRDFGELARHVYAAVDLRTLMEKAESGGAKFLEHLKLLSWACVNFTGANCLKHASPDGVTPAPLRSYVLDLFSAVRHIDGKFAESYEGVREWRMGLVRLYEHRKATGELPELAGYVANMLHKQLEKGIAPRWLKDRILVFSLKDRVEITIYTVGDIVVKPGWAIEVYPASDKEGEVLRRILAESGFKTEPIAYGFRVTTPPGDVREAVKIACMLPAMPTVTIVGETEAYKVTLSNIELLEMYLREQKPVEKRRRGL
jgi:hypothetical protein